MDACGPTIDWTATGAMLQGIGTLVGAVTVLIAAGIGATTFSRWKRQQITGRHIDRAEAILGGAYEARAALSAVRSPMMWSGEINAAEAVLKGNPKFADLEKKRQKRIITCQAYYERLKQTRPKRDKLYELEPMARAIFGAELADAIGKLAHQFWVVQVDVESWVDDNESDPQFSQELRATMYENSGKDTSNVGKDTAMRLL